MAPDERAGRLILPQDTAALVDNNIDSLRYPRRRCQYELLAAVIAKPSPRGRYLSGIACVASRTMFHSLGQTVPSLAIGVSHICKLHLVTLATASSAGTVRTVSSLLSVASVLGGAL